ncbi:MAG: hypothetical protein JWN33_301 [Candidatus Saccharibacteria bacterium]|nr:hypothetical protein [Candidatus Saccharibacteria bacterium]
MLSPTEQWTLHAYYEFTKSLSDAELITHRRRISQSQPSLPHRAGKAVAKLAVFTDRLEAYRARPRVRTRKKGAPYEVRIFSEVNMNIDPVEFARILIQAAKERSDQD